MTNKEFVNKLIDIAKNYKTLYVMGSFGSPMTDERKRYMINHHSYNADPTRAKMINSASADTFGFDCVCLIKGILWGWNGDKNNVHGGAIYVSNGVPDIDADMMIAKCANLSTDFNNIEVGEAVWCKGHIGIYIGDGLAVECTPSWKNCVQITACNCTKSGYNRRNWTKHGKLPYITYEKGESNMRFKDVSEKHWAYKAIEELAEKGIINGYEDGTFRPEEPMTRAEVATIVSRIKGE